MLQAYIPSLPLREHPCRQWTLQILLLKSHWWNKNETKHGYEFERTLTISQYYFLKAYGTFVVPIILKRRMRPLTSKFLNFSDRIIVLRKYVITIFNFHWFCMVAAAHSVVKDSLCVWLCSLTCGSIFFKQHSWRSYLLLIGLNYIVQDLVFYLLSRLSKK